MLLKKEERMKAFYIDENSLSNDCTKICRFVVVQSIGKLLDSNV